MEPTHPLSLAGSSRVISVAALRRLGAERAISPEINDNLLAEVRPHPTFDPNERAKLHARGLRRFIATVENERIVVEVELEHTDEWFLDLMPLRILANIPPDASALLPVSDPADWKPDVARGTATRFTHRWILGYNPKRATERFLYGIGAHFPSLLPRVKPALAILQSSGRSRLTKQQRHEVVRALESVEQTLRKY